MTHCVLKTARQAAQSRMDANERSQRLHHKLRLGTTGRPSAVIITAPGMERGMSGMRGMSETTTPEAKETLGATELGAPPSNQSTAAAVTRTSTDHPARIEIALVTVVETAVGIVENAHARMDEPIDGTEAAAVLAFVPTDATGAVPALDDITADPR